MKFQGRIEQGIFFHRANRFLGQVLVSDKVISCYIPNPGRMSELLSGDIEVYLREQLESGRKTHYDLIIVKKKVLVSIDSRLPNKLMLEAINNHALEDFKEYGVIREEYTYGNSRLDFLLSRSNLMMLLEVKSCTLVRDSVAFFPDAPTKRGSKHLQTLITAKEQGFETAIVFVVQRSDATSFSPNHATDPEFSDWLRRAFVRGVKVYAYSCLVSLEEIAFRRKLPVAL